MPTFRNTIKPWFETGDKPTQSQYWQWMDDIWFKDELIPIININGLTEILNQLGYAAPFSVTGDFTYAVTPGRIVDTIDIDPQSEDFTLNIGTVAGGADIIEGWQISYTDPQPLDIGKKFKNGATLYFTGITGAAVVRIIFK